MRNLDNIFFNEDGQKDYLNNLLSDEIEFNIYFVYNFLTDNREKEIIKNLRRELTFWTIEKLEGISTENYEYCTKVNLMFDMLIDAFVRVFDDKEYEFIYKRSFICELENEIAENFNLIKRH